MSLVEAVHDNPPDFVFSLVEISSVKQIWNDLNIICVGPEKGKDRGSSMESERSSSSGDKSRRIHRRPSTASTPTRVAGPTPQESLPSLQYNIVNFEEFKHQLCCKLIRLDPSTALRSHDILDHSQYVMINTDYQVVHLLQLITIMISFAEYNKPMPTNYLKQMSKANHRIYNLDSSRLLVFGEALISTIINHSSMSSHVLLRDLPSEFQVTFNLFISKLFNLLVYYGRDATLEYNEKKRPSDKMLATVQPVNTKRLANLPAPALATRTSMSQSSTKSSRLSLYLDDDPVPSDEEKAKPVLVLAKFDDDEEDDSYDLLHSFGTDTPKETKLPKRKRTSMSLHHSTSRKGEGNECVII